MRQIATHEKQVVFLKKLKAKYVANALKVRSEKEKQKKINEIIGLISKFRRGL
jgi:hypothetical protein